MKESCIACTENGKDPNNVSGREAVGMACLMANDLLLPFVPSPDDGTLRRLAVVLPFSDYIAHDQLPIELARAQRMFPIASETKEFEKRNDFVDLESEFASKLGMSHQTFSELVFGCSTKFLNVKLQDLSSPEAMVVRSTFFRHSSISAATVEQFFRKVAITDGELAERIQNAANRPADDFTVLQAFPLIRISQGFFICLDTGFLIDKAARGLFWTLFAELQATQKSKLFSFWGAVFEAYVNGMIDHAYKAGGRFFAGPSFENGDPAFDACLLEGRRLLVFEHKSSTIRADCKYGGDPEKLKAELHLKFVEGDEAGAKGVTQLSKSIIRFLDGESLEGISRAEITKIYPCLVCLDNTVGVPYFARYLNEQFRMIFPRKKFKQTITPVMTLNISDVENMLGYLDKVTISDILESYYSNNRAMLSSISMSNVPLLMCAAQGRNVVREGFTQFGLRMEKDLFPNDAS
jgi:hypothetical protein